MAVSDEAGYTARLKIHFDQGETRHVESGSIFCKKKRGMTLKEAAPKLKPKVGESGLGDEQFVKQKYPGASISWSGLHSAGQCCIVVTASGLEIGSNLWETEGEAWADARERIEAIVPPSVALQVQCDCIYQNDPYKAPEQHRRSCPIYVAMLEESVAPQGGEEEPTERTTTEGIHKVHDIHEDRIAKIAGLIEEIKVLKSKLAESVAPSSLPTQDYEQNLRYATQIAEYLHKNCFSEVTQWKPISGDLFGVLMQIDNMCTGVQRRAAVPVAPLSEKDEETKP